MDVEADGLVGAPPVTVVVKAGAHATVLRALRFLGLGERAVVVACDDQDNVRPDALEQALRAIHGPTIVAVECGNVNTGDAAMSTHAAYLEQGTGARDPMDWGLEFSRRPRGVGVYATHSRPTVTTGAWPMP